MNPDFIDYYNDFRREWPASKFLSYIDAYAHECAFDTKYTEERTLITFQDWLLDCFNREHGEKIQNG